MTTTEQEQVPVDAGFELDGRFYRWHVTDTGKDLLLIDRFTGLPINEFFDVLNDESQRGRAPIILAMIATSIRAANPEWTVERIVRTVLDTNLSSIAMIEAEEDGESGPPAEGGQEPPTGISSADGSSPSSTRSERTTLRTSSAILH